MAVLLADRLPPAGGRADPPTIPLELFSPLQEQGGLPRLRLSLRRCKAPPAEGY